jgi:hypothetical protein
MPLHRLLQEFKGCFAIADLGDDAFQHLAFVIDSPPEVVRHPVDLHVDLVQVPLPVAMRAHRLDTLTPDLGGEHRTKPIPPLAISLMADLDAAFVQEILHITERQREPDVQHHCEADDLRARLEIAERGAFCHKATLAVRPA